LGFKKAKMTSIISREPREPHPNPLLPPPIESDKKIVVLLTNSHKLEKSNKQTGFDIRDLAHVCEMLFYYFSRVPNEKFPGYGREKPEIPEEPSMMASSSFRNPTMDWDWIKRHFVIASLHGGEAPLDPIVIPVAKYDILTKEFMSCKALVQMTKRTTKLAELDPRQCCGVIICGGHGCLQDLATSADLGNWLYKLYHEASAKSLTTNIAGNRNGKGVIAAVCHGTAALLSIAKSGEFLRDPDSDKEERWIKDKRITCFSNEEERQLKTDKDSPFLLEDRFNNLGAHVENSEPFEINVIQDERLITAQNTESVRAMTRAFIHTIYKEFGHHESHPLSTTNVCRCP
jgi:putative intracellular protease/amidase